MSVIWALVLATATGLVAAAHWLTRPQAGDEWRTYLHAAAAGGVLIALLLGLDPQAPGAGWRLGGIFLAIATGMLLFLRRQRQKRFPPLLFGLHLGFALLALLLSGALLG